MGRRILRANESKESIRQRAMNTAFKNFADYGAKAQASNQRQAATERQAALDEEARKRRLIEDERAATKWEHTLDKYDSDLDQQDLDNEFRSKKHTSDMERLGWEREDRKGLMEERKVKRAFEKEKFGFLKKKFGAEMARRLIEDERDEKEFGFKEREWKAREARLLNEDKRKGVRFQREGEDYGYKKKRRPIDDAYTDEKRFREGEQYAYENKWKDIKNRQGVDKFGRERAKDLSGQAFEEKKRGYYDEDRARDIEKEDSVERRTEGRYGMALEGYETDRLHTEEDRKIKEEYEEFKRGRQIDETTRKAEEAFRKRKKEEEEFEIFKADRLRKQRREDQMRPLEIERKELALDKDYANMGHEDYKEEQREMAYPLTREAEKKRYDHKFDMEKATLMQKRKIKAAKEIAKAKGKEDKGVVNARERGFTGRAGLARTKKEAQDVRKADVAVQDALGIIAKIKKLGTNIDITDRKNIGLIKQAKQTLAGKLRLPLTGPGILTETEFNRLIDNMGDPSNLFSTEDRELAKLNQLEDILTESVSAHYKAVLDPSSMTEANARQNRGNNTPLPNSNELTKEQKIQAIMKARSLRAR
jgi:hypothetical protein